MRHRTTNTKSANVTVASQLESPTGPHYACNPCWLVKANDDTSWRALYGGIEGFEYQPGYEYRLRIKAEQLPDPPQDGSSIRYTLLEQISKAPATSVIPSGSSRLSRWRSLRSR